MVTGSKPNQSNVDNLNNVRHTNVFLDCVILRMVALHFSGMLAANFQHDVSFQKTWIFKNNDFDHNFQEASIEIGIFKEHFTQVNVDKMMI